MLKVKLLSNDSYMPSRQTEGSAGYDLYASEDAIILAHNKAIISTGISIQLPKCPFEGHIYCMNIVSRSGLSAKYAIEKGAGLIDADYTGEIKVILYNHSNTNFIVRKGDRIAQGIIQMVAIPEAVQVEELDDTARGTGGFGSTGIRK